ncbi:hypothetical protein Y710_02790 [Gordonia sp. QH-12]|uniref:hypothetical protein n=1 Tax=Gordonia TaxID=2053 RepID=UPI000782D779|nr:MULTISPECIES: hypothetical protein [Gordonia]KXT58462.1 hypothetical protein Y710_02790 [Gordonia sp. QH-12]WFN93192.1 hypothetical protein P5P27_01005 [Gordonia sihwensis]
MRSVVSGLFTVVAMICMIVAVPSMWLSQRVVSSDGFTSSAAEAAHSSEVQDYFAQKVAASVEENTGSKVASDLVLPAAKNYARSDGFVEDFSEVARQQHSWLFTAPAPDADLHMMELDISPMINRVIASAPIPVPVSIGHPVIVTIDQSQITAGSLEDSGKIIDVVSWVTVIGAVIAAVIALLVANRRSTVLAWLGVGAVLAGVAGWGLAAFTKHIVSERLADTEQAARSTIEVVVGVIADHLTTVSLFVGVAGAVVAVVGVIARVAAGRRYA